MIYISVRVRGFCRLTGSFANALCSGTSFIFPQLQRSQQLQDFVPLPVPDIIDAHSTDLDIVVEQEIKQLEQPIQCVVVRATRERRVGNRWRRRSPSNRFCQPEKSETAAQRISRFADPDGVWQMRVGPLYQAPVDRGELRRGVLSIHGGPPLEEGEDNTSLRTVNWSRDATLRASLSRAGREGGGDVGVKDRGGRSAPL